MQGVVLQSWGSKESPLKFLLMGEICVDFHVRRREQQRPRG